MEIYIFILSVVVLILIVLVICLSKECEDLAELVLEHSNITLEYLEAIEGKLKKHEE